MPALGPVHIYICTHMYAYRHRPAKCAYTLKQQGRHKALPRAQKVTVALSSAPRAQLRPLRRRDPVGGAGTTREGWEDLILTFLPSLLGGSALGHTHGPDQLLGLLVQSSRVGWVILQAAPCWQGLQQ